MACLKTLPLVDYNINDPNISSIGELMEIIIDTREQLPLSFTGHKTCRRKLDEGDYNIYPLEDKIVIERKTLQDLYGSIIQGHARFKKEILRSKAKGKVFYIFLEGSLSDFYWLNWGHRKYTILPSTLEKIVHTMQQRYDIRFVECKTRTEMSKKIIAEMKKWLTQQEQWKANILMQTSLETVQQKD